MRVRDLSHLTAPGGDPAQAGAAQVSVLNAAMQQRVADEQGAARRAVEQHAEEFSARTAVEVSRGPAAVLASVAGFEGPVPHRRRKRDRPPPVHQRARH